MGRMYRPVEVGNGHARSVFVAILDTGADETVLSQRAASAVGVELYGAFSALCASQTRIEGRYADITIKDLWSGKETALAAGVSDVPFNTDDIDEEGLDVILGVDFVQEVKLTIIPKDHPQE